MASSSGNSWGSTSSVLMEERKRKRMESNRESARRSRMRKQQHLEELVAQAAQLRRENARIAAGVGVASRHVAAAEAENSVLRAQMSELTQRLRSLNDIVGFIDGAGGTTAAEAALEGSAAASFMVMDSLARFSHPIITPNIASADLMFY